MIRRVLVSNGPVSHVTPEWTAGPLTLDQAYSFCERIARSHAENFPVASRFLPAHLRRYVWALYAFARSADDFADEAPYAGRRQEALGRWEELLERCFHGDAVDHPVFVALADTIERCNLPVTPFKELLTAFHMDLTVHRYATWKDLELYIRHAAHPVGRALLNVFGYRDPSLVRYSDDLCAALLLTNFLQDVAIDLEKDRVYLPEEDLLHFGLSSDALFARTVTPSFVDLMRFEVARARALYERGRPLLDLVGPELGFELAIIFCAGQAALDKIEAARFDVFKKRPTLNAADKARVVARAATLRRPTWTFTAPKLVPAPFAKDAK